MARQQLLTGISKPQRIPASLTSRTSKTIQTKLSIGKANDSYEQEADRVADSVVSNTQAPVVLQQKCASCEKEEQMQKKPLVQKMKNEEEEIVQPSIIKGIQKKGKEEELQMKSDTTSATTTPHWVANKITQTNGSGHPLSGSTRTAMESGFGADFSRVRIHTDADANRLSAKLNAQAFTVGNNIYFNKGKYNPQSSTGKHLLAHELTHTIQQKGMIHKKIQRSCTRDIMAEGTCEHLACNSKWACEDEGGISCADGTRNAFSKTAKKYRPLFTCDRNCENGKTCSDSDNWAAVPNTQWDAWGCGTTFTVCANGKKKEAYVRDKSVTAGHYEVSPGIQTALGVRVGATFKGAIYKGTADPAVVDKDACCKGT